MSGDEREKRRSGSSHRRSSKRGSKRRERELSLDCSLTNLQNFPDSSRRHRERSKSGDDGKKKEAAGPATEATIKKEPTNEAAAATGPAADAVVKKEKEGPSNTPTRAGTATARINNAGAAAPKTGMESGIYDNIPPQPQ